MKYLYIILFISSNLLSSTVIYTSSYIDVINESVKENYSITIEKNLITSIDRGFIKIAQGETLIDLRGMTLMPGLMDMHVHLVKSINLNQKDL